MKAIADRWIARQEVVDALTVQAARAAHQPVHLVFGLAEKELREIRAVLPCDPCDDRTFHEACFQSDVSRQPSRDVIVGALERENSFHCDQQLASKFPQALTLGIA